MSEQHRAGRPERDQPGVAPVIAALSVRAAEIRIAELARAERRLRGLTDTEREIVDDVTRSLVSALLREPTARLKEAGAEGARCAEAVRYLFALGND